MLSPVLVRMLLERLVNSPVSNNKVRPVRLVPVAITFLHIIHMLSIHSRDHRNDSHSVHINSLILRRHTWPAQQTECNPSQLIKWATILHILSVIPIPVMDNKFLQTLLIIRLMVSTARQDLIQWVKVILVRLIPDHMAKILNKEDYRPAWYKT